MKLAEALQERADLNKKISDLQGRLNQNSLVQEGEIPNEDPNVLMQELEAAIARLQQLIKDINLTNCATIVEGRSLTQIIAEKEGAIMRLSAYRALADSASTINYRARGSEIKMIATVNVSELQKTADTISKEIRTLDNLLQSTNWTVDLKEYQSQVGNQDRVDTKPRLLNS